MKSLAFSSWTIYFWQPLSIEWLYTDTHLPEYVQETIVLLTKIFLKSSKTIEKLSLEFKKSSQIIYAEGRTILYKRVGIIKA